MDHRESIEHFSVCRMSVLGLLLFRLQNIWFLNVQCTLGALMLALLTTPGTTYYWHHNICLFRGEYGGHLCVARRAWLSSTKDIFSFLCAEMNLWFAIYCISAFIDFYVWVFKCFCFFFWILIQDNKC